MDVSHSGLSKFLSQRGDLVPVVIGEHHFDATHTGSRRAFAMNLIDGESHQTDHERDPADILKPIHANS